MSRIKKSRKPGSQSISAPKTPKNRVVEPAPRKPKKKAGKPAGNRQKEAQKKQKVNTGNQQKKDPRLGSKTPIALGQAKAETSKPTAKAKTIVQEAPLAAIRQYDQSPDIYSEIDKIENDPQLLDIVEKQDANIPLSEAEVDYYNSLMERHQTLSEQLDDESVADEESETDSASENDLWDKLDSGDLSKFE